MALTPWPQSVLALAARHPFCRWKIAGVSFTSPKAPALVKTWFTASGHRTEQNPQHTHAVLHSNITRVFSDPLTTYRPKVNWSHVRLIIVDGTKSNKTFRKIFDAIYFSSYLLFMNMVEKVAQLVPGVLNGPKDLIHVSTDGKLVLKHVDEHYVNSRAFEYGIADAESWQETGECTICLEICTDGRNWAEFTEVVQNDYSRLACW
jgi:hypothetical protein